MTKRLLQIIVFLTTISTVFAQGQDDIQIVRKYIDAYNAGDINTGLTFLKDSATVQSNSTPTELLDIKKSWNVAIMDNFQIEISEISKVGRYVRTTELLTSDLHRYLDLTPRIMTKEYLVLNNKINSITINSKTDSVFTQTEMKFYDYLYLKHPDDYKKLNEAPKNGEQSKLRRQALISYSEDFKKYLIDEENKKPKRQVPFLESFVVTQFGQNSYPYGKYTVQELYNAIKSTKLSDNTNPKIIGWTKKNNVHTLTTTYQGTVVKFIFVHLLNYDGVYSEMTGEINNMGEIGYLMYKYITTSDAK
jgi:hypothetical protein